MKWGLKGGISIVTDYLTCRIHWIDVIISWFSFIFYRYLVDFPQQRLLPTRISFSENKTATALRNFIATCELRPHLRKSCYEQKTPHIELKSFLNKHLYFRMTTVSRDIFLICTIFYWITRSSGKIPNLYSESMIFFTKYSFL